MSAVKIELTKDDKKRINACDEYKRTLDIMKAMEAYKDYEVGTAVLIKEKRTGKFVKGKYTSYGDNSPPSKYLIVENDNGFLFVKRIISTGKPGKEIICITTMFSPTHYDVVTDDEYLDAMLLDEVYDPAAAQKEYKKKKNKASRDNNKHRLIFDNPKDAYNYINKLKIGDKLWFASSTFGDDIKELSVSGKGKFTPQASKDRFSYAKGVGTNRHHINEGFYTGIKVHLIEDPQQTRYLFEREIYFYNICRGDKYRYRNILLYTKKPITPEEVVI